jgi:hypothetical protein
MPELPNHKQGAGRNTQGNACFEKMRQNPTFVL